MHGESRSPDRIRRRRSGAVGIGLLSVALFFAASFPPEGRPVAHAQTADRNAEARVFFEQGNRHFQAAMEAGGSRRLRLLEDALRSYVSSLRIVRSRNALFNAALTLDALERPEEAFSYLSEYLMAPGLSDTERADGEARRDALRPKIAVVTIDSVPSGATVRVDRLDLAAHGQTPVEIALPPGAHTLFLERPHHRPATASVEAERGKSVALTVELAPLPVRLRVDAPEPGIVLLDGEPIGAGEARDVVPGPHVVRYEPVDGPAEERMIEVPAGSAPIEVAFERVATRPLHLSVRSNVEARVRVDGRLVGSGLALRVPVDPGAHRIVVEADGHRAETREVLVSEGVETRLDVRLRPEKQKRRLGKAPLVAGIGTAAFGALATGFSLRALLRGDRYEGRRDACVEDPSCVDDRYRALEQERREVERANRVADGLWLATAALGVGTLVAVLLNRPVEREPSRATILLGPTAGGASIGALLRFDSP